MSWAAKRRVKRGKTGVMVGVQQAEPVKPSYCEPRVAVAQREDQGPGVLFVPKGQEELNKEDRALRVGDEGKGDDPTQESVAEDTGSALTRVPG